MNMSRKVQPEWKRNDENILHTFLPEIQWQEIAKICIEIYKKISESNLDITQFQSDFANTPDAILRGCAVLGWQKTPEIAQDLTSELKAAQLELNQLQNSKSWKLTAPLRWLGDKAKLKK